MSKYIIDANVPLLAGTPVAKVPKDQVKCALESLEFIKTFMENPHSILVLDDEWRVLKEYQNIYEINKGNNYGLSFLNWVLQQRMKGECDLVHLVELDKNVYEDYPNNQKLSEFDPPDRKYIALASKHPEHPPIVEASDSKWWGIKDDLNEMGIQVKFIDEEYIKMKYSQKIES